MVWESDGSSLNNSEVALRGRFATVSFFSAFSALLVLAVNIARLTVQLRKRRILTFQGWVLGKNVHGTRRSAFLTSCVGMLVFTTQEKESYAVSISNEVGMVDSY